MLPSSPEMTEIIDLKGSDRWLVYNRLQELGISCDCSSNSPLKVDLNYPITGIQLWSVVKHITASREVLLGWLDQCWQISTEN